MAKWKNRLLLAKIEDTYGVEPTFAGADALLVSEVDIQPLEVELLDRELVRGSFGNTEKVINGAMSMVKFSVELAGSGTAGTAPGWGSAMRACAFSETIVSETSVTYAPISTAFESVAFQFFSGTGATATEHVILGAQGTWSLEGSAGQIPKLNFEFTGIYKAAAAGTPPTGTFLNQAAPAAFNAANTTPVSVHGYAACLESISLDLANNVVFRRLAGCTENVQITDRAPSGQVVIESPTLASKDYFAVVNSQTLGAFSLQHGQTAGNIATLSMPYCNLGSPAYTDSEGITMLTLPFMPNISAGNDEISIALT